MSLIDRIAGRARDIVRGDPVTLEEFGYLLSQVDGGGTGARSGPVTKTKAGVDLGANRALGVPAWYSGVRYLAESVAFLPVGMYREVPGGGQERRAAPPWLQRPDVGMPWEALVEHWMMSLLHRGNAFAFKLRNGAGQVVGLRAIHPDRVRIGTVDNERAFVVDGDLRMPWSTRDVLHIPGLSYDGVAGIDPLRVHAETLGLAAAQQEYAARHFGQGTHLSAYVTLPGRVTDDELELVKSQWRRFHQGVTNAHEFGVLADGAEYHTIGLDPEQVQLLESRRWGVVEVAQLLRLPPHKLYELSRATFSNIEHQAIEAVMDGIRPWVERLETWVNFDPDLTAGDTYVEFKIEGLLRGDTKTRYESYALGIQSGWMSPREPRRLENLPDADGLDYFLVPLNMRQVGPDALPLPDDGAASEGERSLDVLDLTTALQRIYLAVTNGVISADEARGILDRAGAGLGPMGAMP